MIRQENPVRHAMEWRALRDAYANRPRAGEIVTIFSIVLAANSTQKMQGSGSRR